MAELIENTILGINISHDTSIAVVKDGVLVDVFEEERCRRSKYWSPKGGGDDDLLQSIEQKINIDSIDEIVFSSFDRRMVDFKIDHAISQDRLRAREFIKDITEVQLSRARLDELVEKYEGDFTEEPNSNDVDDNIMDEIVTQQFGLPKGEYQYNIDHHSHHAWCGFSLSDMDDALVITMDGGGCRKLWDEFPTHQEIESIFYASKDDNGTDMQPLYARLTNQRFVMDLGDQLPNELNGCCASDIVESFNDMDVDYDIVSVPSCGMNFSNMSQALGTDKHGRAAGKVMGMASYGSDERNIYNRHNITHQLELDSLDFTLDLIQRATEYKPDCRNIILSGGFALNCTNNYKYLSEFPDYQFFVDPIPHDGGTSAGAALEMYQNMLNAKNEVYCKPSIWTEPNSEEEPFVPHDTPQSHTETKVHPKVVLKI